MLKKFSFTKLFIPSNLFIRLNDKSKFSKEVKEEMKKISSILLLDRSRTLRSLKSSHFLIKVGI